MLSPLPLLPPILLLTIAAWAPPALADTPAGPEDVNVPITEMDAVRRVGPLFEGLLLPQPQENVEALWALRNTMKEKGNIPGELEKLKALEQLRRDLGRSGLPQVSAALAVEAAHQAQAGHGERALELSRWSVRLSPGEPGARLAAAQVALRSGFHLLDAGRELLAWPTLVAKDPLARHRLAALLLLLAFPAALATVLALLFVAGLRHRRALAHDLGHLLPTGPSGRQRGLLVLLLLLAPLTLPCGVFGVIVGWSLLLGPYLRLPERGLAVLGLFLLLFAPGLARVLDRQLVLPTGTRAAIYRVQQGSFTPDDLDRVDQAAAAAPDDPLLRLTQAVAAKRAGDLYAAASHLQAVLEKHPDHRQALMLKALLELAGHRVSSGRQLLDEVVRRWPDCAAAHYDLYRLAQVSVTEEIAGPQHLARAEQLAEPEVDALLADEIPGLNRFLMEDRLPPGELLGWSAEGETVPSRFEPLSAGWLWGSLPADKAQILSATAFFCLLLLWLLGTRLRPAHACEGCGSPLCRRCQPLVGQTGHCETCTPGLALFDGATLVPPALRELAQRAPTERTNRLAALLSLVAPGTGHALQGSTLQGALLLFCWCLLVGRVLLPGACFSELVPWGVVFSDLPLQLAGGGVGLLLLLLGQKGVRREAPGVGA